MAKLLTKKLYELFSLLDIKLTPETIQYIEKNLALAIRKECESMTELFLYKEALEITLDDVNSISKHRLTKKEFRECLRDGIYRETFDHNFAHIISINKAKLLKQNIDNLDLQAAFVIENLIDALNLINPHEVNELNRIIKALTKLCFTRVDELESYIENTENILDNLQAEIQPLRDALAEAIKRGRYRHIPGMVKRIQMALSYLNNDDTFLQGLEIFLEISKLLQLPPDVTQRIDSLHYALKVELVGIAGTKIEDKTDIIDTIFKPTLEKVKHLYLIMRHFGFKDITRLPDMQKLSDHIQEIRDTFITPNDLIRLTIVVVHIACKLLEDYSRPLADFLHNFNTTLKRSSKDALSTNLSSNLAISLERFLVKIINWHLLPSELAIARLREEQNDAYLPAIPTASKPRKRQ